MTENKNHPCLVEQCAESERKRRRLPKGTIVPVMIRCPCPKCSPKITC